MADQQEVMQYIDQLEGELQNQKAKSQQLEQGYTSMFAPQQDQNLIKWQLDLKEELERIDHLLRGHQLKFDDDGNLVFVEPEDDSLKPFNEHGVQLLLNVISFYLNRNTILSNYDEVTINWKVYDFGLEVSDLIWMKYEEMGMDTPEKLKLYSMIVRELVDTVHSAYLRALNGGERLSLREARHVTQNEPLNQQQMYPGSYAQPQQQRKGRWWNPMSWGR